MKHGNLAFKVVAALFFMAVLAYIGVYLYTSINNPFRSIIAVNYTFYDSIDAKGILIRDEIPVSTDYDIVHVTAEEAKRLPSLGIVAVAYSKQEDLERAIEIRFIEAQIEYLENMDNSSLNTSDPLQLQSELKNGILTLKQSLNDRELSSLEDMSINLRTLAFFDSGETVDVTETLSRLNTQLYELGSEAELGASKIFTPASGLFSGSVDGYEDISPDDLFELSPGQLTSLIDENRTAEKNVIGKIIVGRMWYYAANIDADEARKLSVNDTARLIFSRYYNEQLNMRVESIGDVENGICIVVFSCDQALADTISMRKQSAEILKAEYSGIKVPKKAVRLDDEGNTCVYVVTGLQAEKRLVEIVYDTGDFYLVKNETDKVDALRLGDSIIVSAKDLYDGKVLG